MRVVIQRVSSASVEVDNKVVGNIGQGLLVLLGIEQADTVDDSKWILKKTLNLRIFDDLNNVMNKSLLDVDGELLVVSQFTLMASTKKGNRPSYIRAANHNHAIPLYELFCLGAEKDLNKKVARGIFGVDMTVKLTNDGPVTIQIDSKNRE